MSQEHVEIVVGFLLPGPEVDMVPWFREDELWPVMAKRLAPFYWPDFETVIHGGPEGTHAFIGLDGLRGHWREWMAAWATYRIEVEEAIDLGEQVLVLTRDYGRREGSTHEVRISAAPVWSFREGKVACFELFGQRSEALKAVGLEK